jgi:hypothetical protein
MDVRRDCVSFARVQNKLRTLRGSAVHSGWAGVISNQTGEKKVARATIFHMNCVFAR